MDKQGLRKNPSQRVLHHLNYATDTLLFTFWGIPAGRYTLDCSLAHLYQSPLSWGRCETMCLVMPKTHGRGDGGVDGSWELLAVSCRNGECPQPPESGQSEALLLGD